MESSNRGTNKLFGNDLILGKFYLEIGDVHVELVNPSIKNKTVIEDVL
jgi:hypothetical protein